MDKDLIFSYLMVLEDRLSCAEEIDYHDLDAEFLRREWTGAKNIIILSGLWDEYHAYRMFHRFGITIKR